MVIAEFSFYTADVSKDMFDALVLDGRVLRTHGVINARWDDFSASESVDRFGLAKVEWDVVNDDTPGSLTLEVEYRGHDRWEIGSRMADCPALDSFDLSTGLNPLT